MKVKVVEVNGTNNYQAGGFEVTIGELEKVEYAIAQAQNAPYVAQAVPSENNKVKILVKKANTTTGELEEVANGTDLSSYKFTVIAFGE